MRVLKFGGTSLANADRIKNVADIVQAELNTRNKPRAVVVSAFAKMTDLLLEMAKKASLGDIHYQDALERFTNHHASVITELFNRRDAKPILKEISALNDTLTQLLYGIYLVMEASPRTLDYVLSFGERNSAIIVSHFFNSKNIDCQFLDARDVIKTNKRFGSAQVDLDLTYPNIRSYFRKNKPLQVVTGFISSAKGGLTTTLGRGGSDYSVSLIGSALNAKSIEIWTDVNGVLTSDPKKVDKAFTIEHMTYAEAVEMSHFGAKVIYPPTIQPALEKEIPIYIKNTFEPDHPGTFISAKPGPYQKAVKGISSISDICLLTLQGSGLFGVPGIAARLFESLASAQINVILITQGSSEHSISFAVQPSVVSRAKRRVEKEFEFEIARGSVEPVKVEPNLAVIAIIGENMRYMPGVAGKMLTALGNNGINAIAIAQGSSELNISVVINKENEAKALNALHEAFFLSDTKVIHLFMVGVGLIGGTLLEQLRQQAPFLREKRSLEIKVVALANTRKMLFMEEGIPLDNWKNLLEKSQADTDIDSYVEKTISMNLSNSVFVDNTADLLIPEHYQRILEASISISTPNKVATSSNFDHYLNLIHLAENRNVYFGYETNVGAGLPVIPTLRNLIDSGDRVIKIEGVLSGSLSYIFNHFNEEMSFSEAIKNARKLGYTEPDPRIDLNGVDVKRKILILAREAGLKMEAREIKVKNILPAYCQKAALGHELDQALEKADEYFEKIRAKASQADRRLRMIAKLENGKASIALEEVTKESPFYFLSGSDNMIVFTTQRYKDRPLVIQGPGAGAEVTAAGVFAEIIHIGNLL
ncbi:MAG: bifunctional aspartate kinase/homoserine dehydrogenase I [Saprospiraceae bacterium]|nr:bifunctional aspartate kinase/homoserine dehydrogenase I [Saprospiraceae bacterium]